MKRHILLTLLALAAISACTGPDGAISLPGSLPGFGSQNTSSFDLPINSVETWDVVNSKGDRSELSTVKTAARSYRFNGKFPSSFFGQPITVTVSGNIEFNSDGTATLRYTAPLAATVKAIYSLRDGGKVIELTTTDSEPAFAAIGDKNTLTRKAVTVPGR